jgi:hypothetical protein
MSLLSVPHGERADRLEAGDPDDRLTTIASTGRRMKRSVSFISCPRAGAGLLDSWTLLLTWTAAPGRGERQVGLSPGWSPEITAMVAARRRA